MGSNRAIKRVAMSEMAVSPDRFRISLFKNGQHSLARGLEYFAQYLQSVDAMLLKDAILYLHHGIELLLKEVLVRHSRYLIFENIRKATNKQRQANAQGTGIFYLDSPPRTVSYEEALARVEAFVRPLRLSKELGRHLRSLSSFRNQLEHYEIDVDLDEVIQLLREIREPLLDLLEDELGELEVLRERQVEGLWEPIMASAEQYTALEQEVVELVNAFNGQRVAGYLFNTDDEIELPRFEEVCKEEGIRLGLPIGRPIPVMRPDMIAREKGIQWAIEVKLHPLGDSAAVLHQMRAYCRGPGDRAWLILFSPVRESTRFLARNLGVLLTGPEEWQKLQRMVKGR